MPSLLIRWVAWMYEMKVSLFTTVARWFSRRLTDNPLLCFFYPWLELGVYRETDTYSHQHANKKCASVSHDGASPHEMFVDESNSVAQIVAQKATCEEHWEEGLTRSAMDAGAHE